MGRINKRKMQLKNARQKLTFQNYRGKLTILSIDNFNTTIKGYAV